MCRDGRGGSHEKRASRPSSEIDDAILEKYLGRRRHWRARKLILLQLRQGTRRISSITPVLGRLGVQEQGCPAAAGRESSTTCLRPLDVRAITGVDPDDDSKVIRLVVHASPTTQPFSALVFKIMTDPFVGQLAFFRVYSGILESGATVSQHDHWKEGAHRPTVEDAR